MRRAHVASFLNFTFLAASDRFHPSTGERFQIAEAPSAVIEHNVARRRRHSCVYHGSCSPMSMDRMWVTTGSDLTGTNPASSFALYSNQSKLMLMPMGYA